jgi:hypothetical protein
MPILCHRDTGSQWARRRAFFFEKKNQKTFPMFELRQSGAIRRQADESLFASFSSEKEESSSIENSPPPAR